MPNITAAEFERAYAERSGISIEKLRLAGRVVRPCHCDYSECEGWQSVNGKDYEEDQKSHAPLIHSGSGLEEPIVEVAKEKEL